MKKMLLLLLLASLVFTSSACQKNYYSPDSEDKTVSKSESKNIILSENKTTIEFGETYKISAKLPSEYKDKIVFKSENDKIATVDATGLVIAKAMGIVNINVSTEDGKSKVQVKVTVKDMKKMIVTGTVPLSANSGESFTLKINFENCNYPSVKIIVDCAGGKIISDSTSINFNSNSSQYQVLGKATMTFKISDTKAFNTIRIVGFDNGKMIDAKEYNVVKIIPTLTPSITPVA